LFFIIILKIRIERQQTTIELIQIKIDKLIEKQNLISDMELIIRGDFGDLQHSGFSLEPFSYVLV
jgi:FtsZ-binding cell division protein ZapB